MTHIFPIKKGRGSFEKSQQYHCLGYGEKKVYFYGLKSG